MFKDQHDTPLYLNKAAADKIRVERRSTRSEGNGTTLKNNQKGQPLLSD